MNSKRNYSQIEFHILVHKKVQNPYYVWYLENKPCYPRMQECLERRLTQPAVINFDEIGDQNPPRDGIYNNSSNTNIVERNKHINIIKSRNITEQDMSKLRSLIDTYKLRLEQQQCEAQKHIVIKQKHRINKDIKMPAIHENRSKISRMVQRQLQKSRIRLTSLSKSISTKEVKQQKYMSTKHLSKADSFSSLNKTRILTKQSSVKQNLVATSMKEITPQQPTDFKFKKLDRSYHSVEEMFPLPKKRTRSFYNPHNTQQLSLKQLVKSHFQQGEKVICVVLKRFLELKHRYVYFRIPYDLTPSLNRTNYADFKQRTIQSLNLNPNKNCFYYDLQSNPVNSLSELMHLKIVVVSNLPRLEFKIDERLLQRCKQLKDELDNAEFQQNIDFKTYNQIHEERARRKTDFIKDIIKNPTAIRYQNQQKIDEYQQISNKYKDIEKQTLQQNFDPQHLFFTQSPKHKDFSEKEMKSIKLKLSCIRPKFLESNSVRSLTKYPQLAKQYKLSQRDLFSKFPRNEAYIEKTKFNRNQIFKLKSIYEAIVALNVASTKQASRLNVAGIQKDIFIGSIRQYGFNISEQHLRKILKFDSHIDWHRFIAIMELLIHKHSSESLDEYIEAMDNNQNKQFLDYTELVRMIEYGLQRLLIVKDKFYSGYQHVVARDIFKHFGASPASESISVQKLKQFLNAPNGNQIFQYIFFK